MHFLGSVQFSFFSLFFYNFFRLRPVVCLCFFLLYFQPNYMVSVCMFAFYAFCIYMDILRPDLLSYMQKYTHICRTTSGVHASVKLKNIRTNKYILTHSHKNNRPTNILQYYTTRTKGANHKSKSAVKCRVKRNFNFCFTLTLCLHSAHMHTKFRNEN